MTTRRKRKYHREGQAAIEPEIVEGDGLTLSMDRFVDEYLVDYQQVKAVLRVNPDEASPYARAHQLMNDDRVLVAIRDRRRVLTDKLGITQEWILGEYKKLAGCNIQRMKDANGDWIPLHELHPDDAATIRKMNVKSYTEGKGGGGDPVTVYDYDLWDKKSALSDLAKIHGMFQDGNKFSVEITLGVLFKNLEGAGLADELRGLLVEAVGNKRKELTT